MTGRGRVDKTRYRPRDGRGIDSLMLDERGVLQAGTPNGPSDRHRANNGPSLAPSGRRSADLPQVWLPPANGVSVGGTKSGPELDSRGNVLIPSGVAEAKGVASEIEASNEPAHGPHSGRKTRNQRIGARPRSAMFSVEVPGRFGAPARSY
ncbi:hypothetical protein B0H17DRAFT_1124766 [Mycena rosella]|uniref:Uncharacterized protein n=1 Tax=Mycena rosella TaxID=1033263 RepID=A0AAD7GZW0_MYCRO|nr:hypothetical protein B0H17DRAFT_1124766 [Mycena rosella]